MKKTSYILIIGLAVLAVSAFFLPAVLMKSNRNINTRSELVQLRPSGKDVVATLPAIRSIVLCDSTSNGNPEFVGYPSIYVLVTESDSVSAPILTMDEFLKGNLSYEVTKDSVLTMTLTLDAINKPNCFVYCDIGEEPLQLCSITVPHGSIGKISSSFDTKLYGFKEAALVVNGPRLYTDESSFKSLYAY